MKKINAKKTLFFFMLFIFFFFVFLTGDREKFSLPEDVTILHAEFTYYYYPGDLIFPCK